jgi:hypothetical protein
MIFMFLWRKAENKNADSYAGARRKVAVFGYKAFKWIINLSMHLAARQIKTEQQFEKRCKGEGPANIYLVRRASPFQEEGVAMISYMREELSESLCA